MEPRPVYLASITLFGAVSFLDRVPALQSGPGTFDLITAVAALAILGFGLWGIYQPERSGAPTEWSWTVYLTVGAAVLYSVVVVVGYF